MSSPKLAGAASAAPVPDLQILGDQVTLQPGTDPPSTRPGGAPGERNLVEHMARFRESPFEFLREVSLHVAGTGWRAYDDPIGQPMFYRGFTDNMKAEVLGSPMLAAKIAGLAEKRVALEDSMGLLGSGEQERKERRAKRLAELAASLDAVASEILDNMLCKMENKYFIRGAYYFATALLTRAYHQGIHVSSEEILHLREVAEEAARMKRSIVFLPCHRSHVDYVSLHLICYRLGIALPTVVAGDNLGFIGLKQFLQSAGAMWIRRSFAGDALYATVVQAYLETLLREGFHLEAFVEGGRSRTGKLLPPKFGILGYVLDAVRSGRVEDAIVCPVSTQYDKVIETESYISELLGSPKRKENIVDFLNASSVLSLKLGRVDVRFHRPWSLREFVVEQQARIQRLPRELAAPGGEAANARVRLLRTLGYRVLSEINAVSVVMPTALIGTVLLTLRGRGVGKAELVRRVEWLSDRVRAKGGRVAHFQGIPTAVVVERALEVLGPKLVARVDGLAEETYYAVDRFQLSFYRNMTIHLFVTEALLCAGMYTKIKQGGGPVNQRIAFEELNHQVAFLSQVRSPSRVSVHADAQKLFRAEFIYPIEGLTANLLKTAAGLEADSVIKASRDDSGKIAFMELTDIERTRGRENYDFYCFLIWPYVEASWLAAVSLMALTPPQGRDADIWVSVKATQEMAQLFGKTLYHQGDLSYYEAVNKEVLGRSYERFVDEGIILLARSKDPKVPTKTKLAPTWTPGRDEQGDIKPEGKLWDFIEMM